nr:hypothetical protein [uncultured Butyrivibrio sp.]
MKVEIRRVKLGDEKSLAYIQTESWKAAFADILDSETLIRCTNVEKATTMYKRLLEENKGHGFPRGARSRKRGIHRMPAPCSWD